MKLMIKLDDLNLAKELIKLPLVKGLVVESSIKSEQALFLTNLCKEYNKELFLDLRYMLLENEIEKAKADIEKVIAYQVDAFLYTDLGLYELAKRYRVDDKAFYDGGSLLTNSLDATYYLSFNRGVVLARELTLLEIKRLSKLTKRKISLFIGGYLTMSFSRRHYLSAYFAHRKIDINLDTTYWLKEIKREDYYPIQERESGTYLFTESIYLPLIELAQLEGSYDYGFFDTNMLKPQEILAIVNALSLLTKENASERLNNLKKQFKERIFDTGYLYRKTNVSK